MILLAASLLAQPVTSPTPATALPSWAEVREWAEDFRFRAWAYRRIVLAPKVHYKLLRVRSYRDAVIAEVRVTNRTGFPISTDVVAAARRADPKLTDARGAEWEAPYTLDHVHYVRYECQPKLALRPGESLTYSAVISTADGPLGRSDGRAVPAGGRPDALIYRYGEMTSFYQVGVRPLRSRQVYVFGGGRAPVEWSDGPAPGWSHRSLVKVEPPVGALGVCGGGAAAVFWPVPAVAAD